MTSLDGVSWQARLPAILPRLTSGDSRGFVLYQSFRLGLPNPSLRPWILLGILVYLLSPFDLTPSVLPMVGEM